MTLKKLLNKYPEMYIFLAGVILSLLYIIWLGIACVFLTQSFQILIGLTATHILFGRAAGMSFGYAVNLSHFIVIPTAIIIESIMVLLIFPLFILSLNQLLSFKKLEKFMHSLKKAAEKHHNKIKKYGHAGLFLFVCFPFWMTGPLIGCIIGFFLGFSHLKNLSIVLGATVIAIVGWAIILRELHDKIAHFSPYAPLSLLLIICLIALIFNFIYKKSGVRR